MKLTNGLLNPIRRLQQVIRLELESHVSMRIIDPKVLRLVP
jgi:hypothetical protein